MADPKTIKWAYPFPGKVATMNPLQYLAGLANAHGGLYPMGENGLWHGGLHFDQGTAEIFDQSSLRCIADGEVIAYRVDDTYPLSEHIEDARQPRRLPFSSGFVLVKHTLRPTSLDATEPASAEPSVPEPFSACTCTCWTGPGTKHAMISTALSSGRRRAIL
jgi:hypothetical protein